MGVRHYFCWIGYFIPVMFLHIEIISPTFTEATDTLIVEPGGVIRLLVSKSIYDQEEESTCSWVTPDYEELQGQKLDLKLGSQKEHDYTIDDPLRPKGKWKYKWYGSDTTRDCGIEINAAVESDHGSWKCYFKETVQYDVIVPIPPRTTRLQNDYPQDEEPEIMTLNTIDHHKPINISCFSTKARPPPEVTWTLRGEKVLESNLLFTEHNEVEESTSFTDSKFLMTYHPKASDDGYRIGCMFEHVSKGYSQKAEDEANSPSRYLTLFIQGPPDTDTFRIEFEKLEIGEDGIIKCFFHSNPPPQNGGVTWRVHDSDTLIETIEPSEQRSMAQRGERYTSSLENLEDNDYVATLTIKKMIREDLNKEMVIDVKNKHGTGSKQFIVSEPDVNLSGGSIAGITIGVILLVLLVAFLGVYFYKKKKSGSYTST